MAELNGNGPSVRLADGPHTIRFTTRRLVEIEKRFGGFEELQKIMLPRMMEVTGALLWASGKGETEGDALDAMDGLEFLPLAQTLMIEYVRAYAGDEAAETAKNAQATTTANGQAADPTNGATPQVLTPVATSPSPS